MKNGNSSIIKHGAARKYMPGLILYIEDYLIQLRQDPLHAICSADAVGKLQLFQGLKPQKPEAVYRAAFRAAHALSASSHLQRPCGCDLDQLERDIESLKTVCFLEVVK